MTKTKTKNTKQINFRVPKQLCEDFKTACEKMGFTYSAVLTACMIATLRKKQIPFDIGFDDDFINNDSNHTISNSDSINTKLDNLHFFDDFPCQNKNK